ncbi:MAG TPA: tetratricopeptide repeat protein [Candidatus Caenarcaniphilales bacterium]
MNDVLPAFYLSLLLILLGIAAWAVFRQIFKTRKIEVVLDRLQAKLTKEKGTVQEYYELGSIYLSKKLLTQSISQFQKALKAEDVDQEDNLAPVYNGLGYAYFSQEQYDLAIRNYKEALRLNPNYITALNNLGHAYERKKLTVQALEAYEQALTLEPNNSVAKRRAESLRKRMVPSR